MIEYMIEHRFDGHAAIECQRTLNSGNLSVDNYDRWLYKANEI
jgi:hypothetical protein